MAERGAVLVFDFAGGKRPDDAIEVGKHAWIIPGTEEALRPGGRVMKEFEAERKARK
jgi:hypothetical protein